MAVAKSSMRTSRYVFYEDPPQRLKETQERDKHETAKSESESG